MSNHLYAEAIDRFNSLLQEAKLAGEPEPTAMTLATASLEGRVHTRIVLLKHADLDGFVFYTNKHSAKGEQLAANPQCALNFLWKSLQQQVQVRVEGRVEDVTEAEADAYFASRMRESQLGAWASLQSRTLESRQIFTDRYAAIERQFAGGAVSRPPHWSGYRVRPSVIELWFGRAHRLHERECYEVQDGAWSKRLLFP
jgi:pyridoxamine 5'-phosphate oxidase